MTNALTAAPLFVPSSEKLTAMVAAAMAKCDADREQSRLRADARAEDRMGRAWIAEVKGRRYRV
jgi:hypothetical protein